MFGAGQQRWYSSLFDVQYVGGDALPVCVSELFSLEQVRSAAVETLEGCG